MELGEGMMELVDVVEGSKFQHIGTEVGILVQK